MKKFFVICTTILLAGCFYASSLWAIDATLKAEATVKKGTIKVTSEEDLEFGEIIPKPSEKVQILVDASAGAATEATLKTGKATLKGNAHSGLVKVTSPIACELSITYSVGSQQVQESSNSNTLALTNANVEKYSTKSPLTVQANTETDIHIGGLLTIPNNLAANGFDQDYTGQITVGVDYN